MLTSPSSLRSLIHLSRRTRLRRLRSPNPLFPSPLLLAHLRLFSSPSSPSGGDGWATYDSLTDSLAPSAAASSASASASDHETPADSNVWGVYDPVAGRIVMQGQPYSPPPLPSSNSDEKGKNEEKEVVKGKGKGKSSGRKGQGSWSEVAASRKPGGKGAKEKVSYVCSHCGEGFLQWWGMCRQCNMVGTITKYVAAPDPAIAEGLHHAGRSWIPQKSKEMVPQSLSEVTKGIDQAEWRIPL